MQGLPQELRDFIALAVAEEIDRHRSHLEWLLHTEAGKREGDRDQQIAETERAIALGSQARELFPIPVPV